MLNKICLICKRKFQARRYAKYCSLKCRNIFYKGKHFSPNTEFKKGQIYTEERNNKIRKAHKGKPKLWLRGKKDYKHICKVCGKIFITKSESRKICDDFNCQNKKASLRKINPITEQNRRIKISKRLKGKMPKNLQNNINLKDSPPQRKMFKFIKKFFNDTQYNYYLKSNNHKRFLDVALPMLKIDFEYDGKIHLSDAIKKDDAERDKELSNLGWGIYRFNKENIQELPKVIKKIQENVRQMKNKGEIK